MGFLYSCLTCESLYVCIHDDIIYVCLWCRVQEHGAVNAGVVEEIEGVRLLLTDFGVSVLSAVFNVETEYEGLLRN